MEQSNPSFNGLFSISKMIDHSDLSSSDSEPDIQTKKKRQCGTEHARQPLTDDQEEASNNSFNSGCLNEMSQKKSRYYSDTECQGDDTDARNKCFKKLKKQESNWEGDFENDDDENDNDDGPKVKSMKSNKSHEDSEVNSGSGSMQNVIRNKYGE